ncbi:hypothetical protein P8625_07950 [Tenacibaculum tangerinum]|uniref:Uncharacterized protein n=1 Tax=Tenacibaculum tangerinum TaxID=3038772 RepID=A0ABY8KYY7_9FLAO|nr:hypothetical protein [Tenacibaculum tangerinum]WGH74056.1 hypothetical protein P8625_07950 [Tenacibaculum tangerinum]
MERAKEKNYVFISEDTNTNGFSKRHKISYIINKKETIVYTVLEENNKVQFLGVISVP